MSTKVIAVLTRLQRLQQTLLTLTACTLIASPAFAAPITFDFTARIAQIDASLSAFFSAGQIVTGSYRFESTTPDSAPNAQTGLYFNAGNLFTASVGANVFNAGAVDIDISNLAAVDIYRVAGSLATGPALGNFHLDSLVLALTDNATATALASDALPLTPPNLADFNIALLNLAFIDAANPGNVASVNAQITSLRTHVVAVPEPGAILLFLAGLAALGLALRGRTA
jgi:hypothetical protein